MKHAARHIVLTVMLLVATGCNFRHMESSAVPLMSPDKGQMWQLVEQRGREVKSGTMVTLTLNPETGSMHGKAQCNSYYTDFKLTPDGGRYKLTLGEIGCSEIGCPDADMNAEFRYLSLLQKADAMEMTEYTMTLYSKGKEILKYELQ